MAGKFEVLYFSPNGLTEKIVSVVAKEACKTTWEKTDLTVFKDRFTAREYDRDDVVLIAFPAYNGRLPYAAIEAFGAINGNGASAIGIVTNGEMGYGDALKELYTRIGVADFRCIALAAFFTGDVLLRGVKPISDEVLQKAQAFGSAIAKKMHSIENKAANETKNTVPCKIHRPEETTIYFDVMGNLRRPLEQPKAPTVISEKCNGCGLCAERCPMAAINPQKPTYTDPNRCMLCMRCIVSCPQEARNIDHDTALQQKRALWLKLYQPNNQCDVYF